MNKSTLTSGKETQSQLNKLRNNILVMLAGSKKRLKQIRSERDSHTQFDKLHESILTMLASGMKSFFRN